MSDAYRVPSSRSHTRSTDAHPLGSASSPNTPRTCLTDVVPCTGKQHRILRDSASAAAGDFWIESGYEQWNVSRPYLFDRYPRSNEYGGTVIEVDTLVPWGTLARSFGYAEWLQRRGTLSFECKTNRFGLL